MKSRNVRQTPHILVLLSFDQQAIVRQQAQTTEGALENTLLNYIFHSANRLIFHDWANLI